MNKRTKSKTAQPPPRPRASFTSLPTEITTQIALLLDLPTANSLAIVARRFTVPSESRIWQRVNAVVDAKAFSDQSLDFRFARTREEARDTFDLALKERVRNIQKALARRQRKGAVKMLTLLAGTGVSHVLIDMLEEAALSLRCLVLAGQREFRTPDLDMLDLRLLERKLSFPMLTHVKLDEASVRFASFVPFLVSLAPNLTTLDVRICQCLSKRTHYTFPSPSTSTKLQALRLSWVASHLNTTEEAKTLLSLIQHAPLLRQLALELEDTNGEGACFTDALKDHRGLQDMYWVGDTDDLRALGDASHTALGGIRRLVAFGSSWLDLFQEIPSIPTLQILHLHLWRTCPETEIDSASSLLHDTSRPTFADPLPTLPMKPLFAQQLRACPQLRAINVVEKSHGYDLDTLSRLDEIEAAGDITGHIRSLRRGGSELLHARMLLTITWDIDHGSVNGIVVPDELCGMMWHNQYEEALLRATFPDQPLATWRDFTDFEGMVVPIGVIQRMREVEGGDEKWEGRGIEVGEKTWQVLLDWKAGVEAESV